MIKRIQRRWRALFVVSGVTLYLIGKNVLNAMIYPAVSVAYGDIAGCVFLLVVWVVISIAQFTFLSDTEEVKRMIKWVERIKKGEFRKKGGVMRWLKLLLKWLLGFDRITFVAVSMLSDTFVGVKYASTQMWTRRWSPAPIILMAYLFSNAYSIALYMLIKYSFVLARLAISW